MTNYTLPCSIHRGLLTTEAGTVIDLQALKKSLNFAFNETGEEEFMQLEDTLAEILDEDGSHEYTCPKCRGHMFELTVSQSVTVRFEPAGQHDLVDDSHGDMEWDDDTLATCSNHGCRWSGTLGEARP